MHRGGWLGRRRYRRIQWLVDEVGSREGPRVTNGHASVVTGHGNGHRGLLNA